MDRNLRLKNMKSELDSFYESEIVICNSPLYNALDIKLFLENDGFINANIEIDYEGLYERVKLKRLDLIIVGIPYHKDEYVQGIIENIRKIDNDVSIITIYDCSVDHQFYLENSISYHFTYPVNLMDLIKAAKKSIGDKKNSEIGFQFFDALFGLQFSTHRDTHYRTFKHVIRTTKIYGKFLLFLYGNGVIELTSWSLKNCLMASLVHDIGKLKGKRDILYKEGKLSEEEYRHIKKHVLNSIATLLGGHDVDSLASANEELGSVSRYNEKNLITQTRLWINEVFQSDKVVYDAVEKFFNSMQNKPFIHSLNKDLLYIVFRHHDGVNKPYHTGQEIEHFSKIIGKEVNAILNRDKVLDIVSNALALCDIYDALIDPERSYRENKYNSIFALYLIYEETVKGKFFNFLFDEFLKFFITTNILEANEYIRGFKTKENAIYVFEAIHEYFKLSSFQEAQFNSFLINNLDKFLKYGEEKEENLILELKNEWILYISEERNKLVSNFYEKLNERRLIDKKISDFNLEEVRVFDMLQKLYYTYSDEDKRKQILNYLTDKFVNIDFSDEIREKIKDLLLDKNIENRQDFLSKMNATYLSGNILEIFANYKEKDLESEITPYLN